jgi:hypothetical protein
VLLRDDGAAVAFGSGEKGQCGVPDGWYSQVAAGDFHTVLCTTDDRDPLGPGREWIAFGTTHGLEDISFPCILPDGSFVKCAAGGFHTVLVDDKGAAVACGANTDKQCAIPRPPSGKRYVEAAAGGRHTVLLQDDGVIVLLGNNDADQLGSSHPIVAASQGMYTNVACGERHTVCLRKDGTAIAFGYNSTDGQDDAWYFREKCRISSTVQKATMQVEERIRKREETLPDMMADRGLTGMMHFFSYKYTNMFHAWREGLDPEDNQKISFVGFCMAMRKVGFLGRYKEIWAQLDDDKSGTVGFREFDPEIADSLENYKLALRNSAQGSLINGWFQNVDTDRSDRVDRDEFVKSAAGPKLSTLLPPGFDAKQLFTWLDYSRTGVITLDRLCPTSYQAYARGDHKSGVDVLDYKISIKEIKSTSFKTLREARESFLGSYARRMVAEADAKAKERDLKASDLAGFKKQLKRKYGNLFRAWKQGLDLSGDNQLSKGEFMKAIVNEGYLGNPEALWGELHTSGDGFIQLKHFEPLVGNPYEEFQQLLRVESDENPEGSLITMWIKHFDPKNTLRCTFEQWEIGCKAIGFTGPYKKLFTWLDLNDSGDVTLDEIDHEAAASFHRGDHEIGLA